jgi:hypothetical protein
MAFELYKKETICKFCKSRVFWKNRLPFDYDTGIRHYCEEYKLHRQAQYIRSYHKHRKHPVRIEKKRRTEKHYKNDGGIVVIEEENTTETPIIERRLNED